MELFDENEPCDRAELYFDGIDHGRNWVIVFGGMVLSNLKVFPFNEKGRKFLKDNPICEGCGKTRIQKMIQCDGQWVICCKRCYPGSVRAYLNNIKRSVQKSISSYPIQTTFQENDIKHEREVDL